MAFTFDYLEPGLALAEKRTSAADIAALPFAAILNVCDQLLDEALSLLERHDAETARLVKLRYFASLSHRDAAEAMGISRGAADRLWAFGRAWLLRQLSKS